MSARPDLDGCAVGVERAHADAAGRPRRAGRPRSSRSRTSTRSSAWTAATSARSISAPVASPPACTTRDSEWPPSRASARAAVAPSPVRSNTAPSAISSRTRSGPSVTSTRTASGSQSPAPAASVSERWSSAESGASSAAATPPCAYRVAERASSPLVSTTHRQPAPGRVDRGREAGDAAAEDEEVGHWREVTEPDGGSRSPVGDPEVGVDRVARRSRSTTLSMRRARPTFAATARTTSPSSVGRRARASARRAPRRTRARPSGSVADDRPHPRLDRRGRRARRRSTASAAARSACDRTGAAARSSSVQVRVAARHRDPVGLAHERAADARRPEVEVGGHLPDHRELLEVLAAEERDRTARRSRTAW